jgi:hypothetical protein
VAITLKGIVQSKPQLAGKDQRDIAVFLFQDKTYNGISCLSSMRFNRSTKWKRGDKVVLLGKWERPLESGQPMPIFIFNSAIRQAARFQTEPLPHLAA